MVFDKKKKTQGLRNPNEVLMEIEAAGGIDSSNGKAIAEEYISRKFPGKLQELKVMVRPAIRKRHREAQIQLIKNILSDFSDFVRESLIKFIYHFIS